MCVFLCVGVCVSVELRRSACVGDSNWSCGRANRLPACLRVIKCARLLAGTAGHHPDLHIIFDIAFPTEIDKERSKYLCKILPLPRKQIWDTILDNTPTEDITHHKLEYYNTDNIKQNNTSRNQHQKTEDDLEYVDINTGEPRRVNVNNPVECATQ